MEPLLEAYCTRHALPFDATVARRMADYRDLLLRFNNAMNLIGPMGADALTRELLLDSLSPAACAPPPPGAHLLDVGTGAGLPGIPLKILYPDRPITLVEPRRKRVTFLTIAINRLGLDDVNVVHDRIEPLIDAVRTGAHAPFDWIVSKAFQPPADWLTTATQLCAPRGHILCMSRHQLAHEIEAQAQALGLTDAGRTAADANLVGDTHTGVADRMVFALRKGA